MKKVVHPAMGALALTCIATFWLSTALFLDSRARDAQFDAAFLLVQVVERIAGAANLALLGLDFRDGLMLTGRLRPRAP